MSLHTVTRALWDSEPRGSFTLTIGSPAYVDTIASGLVPCHVVACLDPTTVAVRVSAARPGYPRGTVDVLHTGRVIPRDAVYVRAGMFRVCGAPIVVEPPRGLWDALPSVGDELDAASRSDISARLIRAWKSARTL